MPNEAIPVIAKPMRGARASEGLAFTAKTTLAAGDGAERVVDVVCSTDRINCYGYRIDQGGWDLADYQANPVVLYMHNEQVSGWEPFDPAHSMPIGRAEDIRVEDGALRARIRLASEAVNPMAERVWQAFREEMIRAVSVGFEPVTVLYEKIDGEDVPVVTRARLNEISVCPIGGDPGALREKLARSTERLRALATTPASAGLSAAAAPPPEIPMPESVPGAVEGATLLSVPSINVSTLSAILACEESEAACIAALEQRKSELANTKAGAALAGVVLTALSLPPSASEAEVAARIATLTARATKADELEPEVTRLSAEVASRDLVVAEREVDFLFRRGADYQLAYRDDEAGNTRKMLLAARKNDPQSFELVHKAALDGLRAFDDPRTFETLTAKGGALATSPAASAPSSDDGSFEARVERHLSAAKAAGRTLTRSQASAEVAHGVAPTGTAT